MTAQPFSKRARIEPGEAAVIVLVSAAWLLAVWVVEPFGDFPLNDDWKYGRSVLDLLHGHGLRIHDATTPVLVGQIFWGALFCLPSGFSFVALRLSTLALGWAGLVASYVLFRLAGGSQWVAILGTLSLGFNPLYFGLAPSFMTDVPFTAFTTAAAILLARAIRDRRRLPLVAGLALTAWAILIRQLGLALLFAFALAVTVRRGVRTDAALRMLPALGGAALLAGVSAGLRAGAGEPLMHYGLLAFVLDQLSRPATQVIWMIGVSAASAMLYLGLFLLPLLLLPAGRQLAVERHRRAVRLGSLVLVTAVAARMLFRGRSMPVSGTVFLEGGLGPLTLPDVFSLNLPNAPSAPTWLPLLLSIASLAGAGLLAERIGLWAVGIWQRRAWRQRLATMWFPAFAASASLLLALLFLLQGYFDRYLLPVVPLAASLLVRTRPGRVPIARLALAAACVAGLAAFSVAATHDYLAWNRLRWEIAAAATGELGIPAAQLSGGYELDGWLRYESTVRAGETAIFVPPRGYMIAFGPAPGFEIVRRHTYPRWLPPGESPLYLLRASARGPR